MELKDLIQEAWRDRDLLKETLEIVAGIFTEKPGIVKLARMGGILP